MAGSRSSTFTEIVQKTRGRNATDHRDQIYATLGLVCGEDQDILPMPDYSKPVSEVYQEAMVAIFNSYKTLDFLKHAPKGRQLDLPSWCADISKKNWNDSVSIELSEGTVEIGRYVNPIVHNPHSGTLRVAGKILDIIWRSDLLAAPLTSSTSKLSSSLLRKVFHGQVNPFREDAFRLLADFINRVIIFTFSAYEGFELRLGTEEASKRIAAGNIWEAIGKCQLIRILSRAACAAEGIMISEEEDQANDYSLTGEYVRETIPTWGNNMHRFNFYSPLPTLPKRKRLRQSLLQTLLL